jgi:curli production assembly/transport component CsgG
MRITLLKSFSLAVSGCSLLCDCTIPRNLVSVRPAVPTLSEVTPAQRDLVYLPPPAQPIPIAVYGFSDQTGQLKPSDTVQSLSRAVTQGGTSVLIKALRDAGNGNWFTVVERERLDNVLKEREIIRQMRNRYLGETETPANVLPSLLFAGILLEGGIIGYDTNLQTGGVGARFLAIGASTQYRQNTVTVYLRAVSVKTGEVLANVVTTKTVASIAVSADVFKFVTFDKLFEGEAGFTANEPTQIAVEAAIEKAVYAMIMEGAQVGPKRLWSFADQKAGEALLARYAEEKGRAVAAVYWKDGGPSAGVASEARGARRDRRQPRPQGAEPNTGASITASPLVPGVPTRPAAAQPGMSTATHSM